MPTLVLPPRINEDATALANVAQRSGWSVYFAPGWRLQRAEIPGDRFVLFADPLFADVAASTLEVALIEPSEDWLPKLPETYRKRPVTLTTLAEARRMKGPFFAKPPDTKWFLAQVYNTGSELPNAEQLPDETPVLLSEPVVWTVEYRCFVRERRVVTFSPYLREGELARGPNGDWPASDKERIEAFTFASRMVQDSEVDLPPVVVVDVGIIEGRGWAVVEANPAWGSGIYGCDPAQVLPVLELACPPCAAVSSGRIRWLRPETTVEG